MDEYNNRLKIAMRSAGYSEVYVESCLSYSSNLINQKLPVIFDRNHLRSILQLDKCKLDSYHEFSIRNSIKVRYITSPSKPLKIRQRWILDEILSKVNISKNAHGFTRGKSIITNAQQHIGQGEMINIDLNNFFGSIRQNEVERVFLALGYSNEVSVLLAELCTYKGVLPQGAPTSPALSNIISIQLDEKLEKYALEKKFIYTRYADDMTFSGCKVSEEHLIEVTKIINGFKFHVNDKKTKFFNGSKRKFITGIVVGDTNLSLPRRYKREFKQEIYYCRKFGAGQHLENIKATRVVNYKAHMYGKAYFVKMVNENLGNKYLKELDEVNWD